MSVPSKPELISFIEAKRGKIVPDFAMKDN